MSSKSKPPKRRNPVAKAVKRLKPRIVPSQRKKKLEEARRREDPGTPGDFE